MLYKANNPHGGDIYGDVIRHDFSANINPYGTPPGVLRAVEKTGESLRHYPDPYCRKLVSAIAEFEGVPEKAILCGNGAAELIYSYCAALRPRKALMPAPTFLEYSMALAQVGCRTEYFCLTGENDFRLNGAFLDAMEKVRPDAVFLCNPNNPTGRLIDRGLLRDILDQSRARGVSLFVDECFLDLSEGGRSLSGELAANTQLIILKAFTKSYGMAGLRLGYCLSGDEGLLEKMAGTVQAWNVSTPAQAAGVAALREQEHVQKARRTFAVERPRLKKELEALGFWVCPSEANFLLFHAPEGLHRKLRRKGIAIRDCSNYPGLSSGWYRIAVRQHEENQILIDTMREVLDKE